jgi:hypothetical protein
VNEIDYVAAISELENKYNLILRGFDLSKLFSDSKLSGIFLAMPDQSYFKSSIKVMIVGQETRSWRDKECVIRNQHNIDFDSIRESMSASLNFIKKNPGRSRFLQFYKKASSRINFGEVNSSVWCNQFCVSFKGGSPVKSKNFNQIEELSSLLLRAQFETLKPDVAIFAVGSSRDKFLKETFVCENSKVITPRRLWNFKVGNTNCYRVNHPRWYGSSKYIDEAIELSKVCT